MLEENVYYITLRLKRTKKKWQRSGRMAWQRSGKELTDPAVKDFTKALVKMLGLLPRLSPLYLKGSGRNSHSNRL